LSLLCKIIFNNMYTVCSKKITFIRKWHTRNSSRESLRLVRLSQHFLDIFDNFKKINT
jgi:hypothetical protein